MIDHKLANIRQRELKLRNQRKEILEKDSETALDMILEAPSPAALIQSFPDQDLFYLMHKIGPQDFVPVLALARSDQWEHILDMEVWEDDRLNTTIMAKAFDVLFRADPERFLRWIIKEKPDYFEYFLYKHVEIHIREHDEPPPSDSDTYITLDDKFYFRFPKVSTSGQDDPEENDLENQTPEQIETMIKKLAQMDLSVFHGLLLEVKGLLPAETEEEQFRLKTARLAEKGFLPVHEAIGIYQPTDLKHLRKRPRIREDQEAGDQVPIPPQYFSLNIKGEDLFSKALALVPQPLLLRLESETAALINKIISADRITIREKQDMDKPVQKAGAYLSLGLEKILSKVQGRQKPKLVEAAKIIETHFLEDIFRTGSRAAITLKTRAEKWYKDSFLNQNRLPLSFLDQKFLGVIGGLFLDRPLFFDLQGKGDLYRDFRTLEDIDRTGERLDRIMALDQVLGKISPDMATFRQGVLTYKSMLLTLWARNRIGLDMDSDTSLEPIALDKFKPFFSQLFDPRKNPAQDLILGDMILWSARAAGISESEIPPSFKQVLGELIGEIGEEYGQVDPDQVDPRFMPHFLLDMDIT